MQGYSAKLQLLQIDAYFDGTVLGERELLVREVLASLDTVEGMSTLMNFTFDELLSLVEIMPAHDEALVELWTIICAVVSERAHKKAFFVEGQAVRYSHIAQIMKKLPPKTSFSAEVWSEIAQILRFLLKKTTESKQPAMDEP